MSQQVKLKKNEKWFHTFRGRNPNGPFHINDHVWVYIGSDGGTIHVDGIEEIYKAGIRQAVIPISASVARKIGGAAE